MAMLLLNDVFERTWGGRAGAKPATEYWTDVIPVVKRADPDFLFIAEAYWDMEWELQQKGFDFCYDKRLYDRLEHDNAESVRLHLSADAAIRISCCASWRITTSPRGICFPPSKNWRRPYQHRPCPAHNVPRGPV
jgi:hypothetical protein